MSSSRTAPLSAQDLHALQTHHEFVRDDDADRQLLDSSWERRMARKFYNKLFKEFALADLTRYREGRVGLRWRSEAEVESGKGQHSCGGLRCPSVDPTGGLHSYEVPFQYSEGGETKLELVKVRLCPSCAEKLFFHSISTSKSTEKKRETSERKQHSSESDYPALSSSAESRSVASDSKKKRKLNKT